MRSLAKFFDFSSDLLCVLDTGCNLKRINPAFSQILGWDQNIPSLFSFFTLIHPRDHAQVRLQLSRLLSQDQDKAVFKVQTQHQTGSFSEVQWTGWFESQEEICLMGHKITAAKVENHLHDQLRTQNKLFSIIAHDMRNFMGQSQSLGKMLWDNLPQDLDSSLGKMAEQNFLTSKRLFLLLENLLSWTQMQEGQLHWQEEEVLMDEWLQDIMVLFAPLAEMKQIRLYTEGQWPSSFLGDRQIMNAILRNLISNALKFTHPNGEVWLQVQKVGGKWWLSVSDNGIGIPQNLLEGLRHHSSRNIRNGTAKEQGSGLGLRLCQDLVLLYGGELQYDSCVGQGTRMAFSLPEGNAEAIQRSLSAFTLHAGQVEAQA